MEFGIFNLMGAREVDKSAAQVFAEVAEQTRLADQLGYATAWFAEHHFSNYCLCPSPLTMTSYAAGLTTRIKLGPAVVDGGNPFSGAVNKIKPDGTIAKGPIGQRATGYSILEAGSLDKATKMAKGCPIIKSGGQIAVYETFNAM